MAMIKKLGTAVDLTTTGALTGVELGETPFFPGGNAILRLTAAIGGAGVITIQGSADGTTWFTNRTINAASGVAAEVTDLPKHIRLNKTTAGTGTVAEIWLEGVQ
jgi:hypothetical protein